MLMTVIRKIRLFIINFDVQTKQKKISHVKALELVKKSKNFVTCIFANTVQQMF